MCFVIFVRNSQSNHKLNAIINTKCCQKFTKQYAVPCKSQFSNHELKHAVVTFSQIIHYIAAVYN